MNDSLAIDKMPIAFGEIFDQFSQWEYAVRLAERLQFGEIRITVYNGKLKMIATTQHQQSTAKIK